SKRDWSSDVCSSDLIFSNVKKIHKSRMIIQHMCGLLAHTVFPLFELECFHLHMIVTNRAENTIYDRYVFFLKWLRQYLSFLITLLTLVQALINESEVALLPHLDDKNHKVNPKMNLLLNNNPGQFLLLETIYARSSTLGFANSD